MMPRLTAAPAQVTLRTRTACDPPDRLVPRGSEFRNETRPLAASWPGVMVASRSATASDAGEGSRKTEPPSFELTRFAWAAPDRLDVSGVFVGLDGKPAGAPTLVVRGGDREQRLPAVEGSVSGDPADP